MQTVPVGLLRVRELRNRHIKGDFVPAGGAFPWRRQDGVCVADERVVNVHDRQATTTLPPRKLGTVSRK